MTSMNRFRSPIAVAMSLLGVVTAAASAQGCELLVQLDRSAVDAGGDAGCAICSDIGDDAGVDASSDGASAEAGSEASSKDARTDGPTADSATRD